MNPSELLYAGKAKSVFLSDTPGELILHFRNDTSAYDGEKVTQLARKGLVNNHFNAFIMQRLADAGIATHFIRLLDDTHSLVKQLEMIPVECVVRNITAGGICRRLGVEEGLTLETPIFEFFLKNDPLHDPMLNDDHIIAFGWASREEIAEMRRLTFQVNTILKPLFAEAGMQLVDYKLEFGRCEDKLVLGDEFTPDGCRIWDSATGEKLDKDRFRRDLGHVVESYEQVASRLGIHSLTL